MKRKFGALLVRWLNNVFILFKKWTILAMKVATICVDLLILYQAMKNYCSKNLNNWSWIVFFIANIIMLSLSAIFAIKEHKGKNLYMLNFWVITWFFIVAIYFLTISQQSNISSFLSNENIDNVFILFIWAFVIMVIM